HPERERVVTARDEVVEPEETAGGLRHLRTVELEEMVVQPVPHEALPGRGLRLGDLALVMREEVILATGVEVEGLAEVFHRHGRALDVPAGIPAAPRRIPLLEITRLRGTPEREVERVPLIRIHLDACAGLAAVRRL